VLNRTTAKYWLVTGAGGYIGRHVVSDLESESISILASDKIPEKFIRGISESVPFYQVDLTEQNEVENIFKDNNIEGVIHLAALKSVENSEKDPMLYRNVNVIGTLNLLKTMQKYKVKKFIFTSSAAVYGETKSGIATETDSCNPSSNYGRNKLEIEEILYKEYVNKMSYVSLRLFNVGGTKNMILKDESQDNLIPIIVRKLQNNEAIKIFGNDYKTPDGTPCRDFIHVADVARAFRLSIEYLSNESESVTLNIGSGSQTSVLQIVNLLSKQLNTNVEIQFCNRRNGDIGILVANTQLAQKTIGFSAQITIEEILSSVR
jgi:UDP-glucose 4-epimerase